MADEADIANDLIEHAMRLSLSRVLPPDHAAKPLTDECEECGVHVGLARRKALPYATRCVACQSALEKTDRMYR